jgi:hypothetical protein
MYVRLFAPGPHNHRIAEGKDFAVRHNATLASDVWAHMHLSYREHMFANSDTQHLLACTTNVLFMVQAGELFSNAAPKNSAESSP